MIEYKLVHSSRRKKVSICVTAELEVIVKAPERMTGKAVDDFVRENEEWIENSKKKIRKRNEELVVISISQEDICELKRNAKKLLPEKTAVFGAVMGVSPAKVKITSAQNHWGTCIHRSSGDNICFSYKVMILPERLIDYIVVHELAHIKVRNHGAEFYREVSKYIPDYEQRELELQKIYIKGD